MDSYIKRVLQEYRYHASIDATSTVPIPTDDGGLVRVRRPSDTIDYEEWTETPAGLCRSFRFDDDRRMFAFLAEIRDEDDERNCGVRLLIQRDTVTVMLPGSDGMNGPTERDHVFASMVDSIRRQLDDYNIEKLDIEPDNDAERLAREAYEGSHVLFSDDDGVAYEF